MLVWRRVYFYVDESAWLSASDATASSSGNSHGAPKAHFPQSRSAVLSLYRSLEARARASREQLVGRLHSHLTHLLTNALGGASPATTATASTAATGPGDAFLSQLFLTSYFQLN